MLTAFEVRRIPGGELLSRDMFHCQHDLYGSSVQPDHAEGRRSEGKQRPASLGSGVPATCRVVATAGGPCILATLTSNRAARLKDSGP